MHTRRARLLFAIAGLAALAGALALVRALPAGNDRAGSGAPGTADAAELEALRDSIARLELELALAHASNEEVAGEIEGLRREIRELAAAGTAVEAPPAGDPGPERRAGAPTPGNGARLDEAALLGAGFDPRDVAAVRSRLDAIALERLRLRDRAVREGWLGTPRWREERRALAEELFGTREEFGEDLYDWAMYAAGQPNRVIVADVMQGSAAAEAGLAPGDVILSYDDRRIFRTRELRDHTTAGTPGETTSVDVLRGGETLRVYLPRGPLGVTIEPGVRMPAPAG